MSDQKVIVANIDIAAPNIIIPHKPSEERSPLLILVLGKLSFKTDLDSTKKAISDVSSGSIDSDSSSDIFLYKKFKIDLKQIHAFFSTVGDFSPALLEDVPEKSKLIDKFDVGVKLDFCRAHSDKLALIKVETKLPELKAYLNSRKLTSILLIIDAITASDGSSQGDDNLNMDKLLSQVAKQESERAGGQALSTNEKQVDASFSIPHVSVFIRDDEKNDENIIALQLSGIDAQFEKTSYDMSLTASLNSTSK